MLLLGAGPGCARRQTEVDLLSGVQVMTFRHDYANAHVVRSGAHVFMMDAGLQANAKLLESDLRAKGIAPERLRAIVLSHGHADHAGGAAYFRKKFGTPIVAGAGDRQLLAHGQNDHLCPTSSAAQDRVADDQVARFEPFEADVWVDGPADLQGLTGVAGSIVPIPGHTEGSLVVIVSNGALVGDLFRGAILANTAEAHYYMCDLDDNRRDVKEVLERWAPSAAHFFVGHFGEVSRHAVVSRFGSSRAPGVRDARSSR